MIETLALKAKDHLVQTIIPFWLRLKDEEYGGYYGKVGFDLTCYKKALKGVVQTCRILYFFSEAAMLLSDEASRRAADHAYHFLLSHGFDQEKGGLYWSLSYNGVPEDTTKSSFCFAHGILALTSYYRLTHEPLALVKAWELHRLLQQHFCDSIGYKEVLCQDFSAAPNTDQRFSKGSYGGTKTMNTLLHLLEAYESLYLLTGEKTLLIQIDDICSLFTNYVYDDEQKALTIYFDDKMQRSSSYKSYGHEIEASWMLSNCVAKIPECRNAKDLERISEILAEKVLKEAFFVNSVMDEVFDEKARVKRVHWVQAEAILGFVTQYQRKTEQEQYLQAALSIWDFIMQHLVDTRAHSEWLYMVDVQGKPTEPRALVWTWKSPYNNGRMCIELVKRCISLT